MYGAIVFIRKISFKELGKLQPPSIKMAIGAIKTGPKEAILSNFVLLAENLVSR